MQTCQLKLGTLNLNIFIGILCEHSNPAVEQIGIDQCLLACFAVCRAVENGGGAGGQTIHPPFLQE